ncbi:putative zinc-binding protein [Pontiellaceae bacterium B12227]|nr:putative zinc-binding protein [Pontiellaceae bacterium B12227]
MNANEKVCSSGPKLVFACSGAADVGALADQAARKMSRDGTGSMFCMAGVGGKVEPILKKTGTAEKILAIDGCPLNCVKATLEQAGFNEFEHLLVTDQGFTKGQTEISEANVARIADLGATLLR